MSEQKVPLPELVCQKCKGTGLQDSGGVHPWGEPIFIPCDCADQLQSYGDAREQGAHSRMLDEALDRAERAEREAAENKARLLEAKQAIRDLLVLTSAICVTPRWRQRQEATHADEQRERAERAEREAAELRVLLREAGEALDDLPGSPGAGRLQDRIDAALGEIK